MTLKIGKFGERKGWLAFVPRNARWSVGQFSSFVLVGGAEIRPVVGEVKGIGKYRPFLFPTPLPPSHYRMSENWNTLLLRLESLVVNRQSLLLISVDNNDHREVIEEVEEETASASCYQNQLYMPTSPAAKKMRVDVPVSHKHNSLFVEKNHFAELKRLQSQPQ